MRITEILFWNNEPGEANDYEPQLDQAPARSSDDVTNLATAFTRRGMVKHFWNLNGSEGQPSGPAPPDAETELIPSGTLEPTTAPWPAEPVEEEPPVGLHRFVPFRNTEGYQMTDVAHLIDMTGHLVRECRTIEGWVLPTS